MVDFVGSVAVAATLAVVAVAVSTLPAITVALAALAFAGALVV